MNVQPRKEGVFKPGGDDAGPRPWYLRVGSPAQIIIFLCVALLGLVVWAALAEIDQLVRARGQVIAAARTQVVQAADNGVLRRVLVTEGQMVKRGTLLAEMDDGRVRAAYDDSRNKVAALKTSLARLRAEVYGGQLAFPAELIEWPQFRQNQTQLYQRRQQALREGVNALAKSRDLVSAELSITEPLVSSGDVGQVEVIRLKRSKAELDGQIVNLQNRYFQEAQADMTKAEEELAAQEEVLRDRSTLLSYMKLTAAVDGQVNRVIVTTPGAPVRQGETVLELLPTTSELIVEAKYPPSDVATLRVGLPATVKLDAYDASIYGSREGEVVYISPDALKEQGPQGMEQYYYRVHIRLLDQKNGLKIPVNAGMTATVEVRSLKRTVLSYLTKPITKTLSNSLSEH